MAGEAPIKLRAGVEVSVPPPSGGQPDSIHICWWVLGLTGEPAVWHCIDKPTGPVN